MLILPFCLKVNLSVALTGEEVRVYNLTVSNYHTYFVGSRSWGLALWVHNADQSKYVQGLQKTLLAAQEKAAAAEAGAAPSKPLTAAEKLQARRAALLEVELKDAASAAEKAGKLNDLNAADRAWLNADPTGKRKLLAYDPATKSFKPNEAKAALAAEAEGALPGPVRRDFASGGRATAGDVVDAANVVWDVKDASAGAEAIANVAAKGENVLVDAAALNAADRATLLAEINQRLAGKAGAARVVVTPKP